MKRITMIVLAALLGLTAMVSGVTAKEYLVGVELPLTGAYSRMGNGTLEGITVGANIFNKKNPKYAVKLISIDDEGSPAKAVSAVEKLISQGVVAITGGYGSNMTGPASEAANKSGIVFLSSGATAQELTERGLKTFFRTNGTAGYVKGMHGLFSDMGVKSISIVYSTKEATSTLAQMVQKDLTVRGIKVAMHSFDPAINDFKPIINKIKLQDRSEVIAMYGYENDYVGIIRAAKVLKPASVKAIVGGWSLAVPKMATDFPDLMPNVFGAAMIPHPVVYKDAEGKQFADEFRKLYKKDPDYAAQYGFVQAQIICEAIKRAAERGTLAKGGLVEEVRKTNRNTLIGRVTFDKTGDNPNFLQKMGQHQNGKIAIVWPKKEATGNMKFPAVPW
jgi:branched-chain amino acid transport system substrate-binding protein